MTETPAPDAPVLTVSDANRAVRDVVEGSFAEGGDVFRFSVSGLTSDYARDIWCDYTIYARSEDGLTWTVVEKGKMLADANGVLGPFELTNGQKVVVRGQGDGVGVPHNVGVKTFAQIPP